MSSEANTNDGASTGPFSGIRVVELAQWVFVPVAGALLADWGADVIRIEKNEGDPYRGLATQGIGTDSGGVNLSLAMANRGKRSLALDLQPPAGIEIGQRRVLPDPGPVPEYPLSHIRAGHERLQALRVGRREYVSEGVDLRHVCPSRCADAGIVRTQTICVKARRRVPRQHVS